MPTYKPVFIGTVSVYILFKMRDIYDEYKMMIKGGGDRWKNTYD